MDIFFIYPTVNLERGINYGIACLFGVIAERGHTVDLYQPVGLRLYLKLLHRLMAEL